MTGAPFTFVDLVVLGFLAWHVVRGFLRGFASQAIRLAALCGGALLAARFAPALAEPIGRATAWPPRGAEIAAWTVILFACFLAGVVVAHQARRAVGALDLSSYDRLGGALLGGAKAAVLATIAVIAAATLGPPGLREPVTASRSFAAAVELLRAADPLVPEAYRERVQEELEALPEPTPAAPQR